MTAEALALTDFLLARIAEVEDWLFEYSTSRGERDRLMACSTIRREMIADCEAKRKVVAECGTQDAKCPPDDWPETGGVESAVLADFSRWILRHLAIPYADHPDYREEWRV